MAIGLALTIRNNRLNIIRDAIDAGGAAGLLHFYTATRPATGAAITDQVLLGTVTFSYPSAPDAANAALTFSAFTEDTSADNGGIAAWARAADSAGNFAADLSVGGQGSGADIELNTTSISAGGPIQVTSGVLNEPNG